MCTEQEALTNYVATDKNTKMVATGFERSCAIRGDGSLGCRDSAESGWLSLLGDGRVGPRWSEVDVRGFEPVRAHATGG